MTPLPVDSVVIISPFAWPGPRDMWQATHHIARGFARRYPTLFVEPPTRWSPTSEVFDTRRLVSSMLGASTRRVANQLSVFQRRALPLGRFAPIREFSLRRNAALLRRELAHLGYHRPLLWHSFPYWSTELVDAVAPAVFAYHCLDHSERSEERTLVEGADAVFAVSDGLLSRLRQWNTKSFLLRNGVDLSLFDTRRAAESPRPRDLPSSGRLFGFAGSINYHLDIEALVRLAEAFPQDSLVLLGRIMKNETRPGRRQSEALTTLLRLPNAHFLGFRPAADLAGYIAAFDVALNPLLPDPFNAERDPMKFYQYLAMGKPIVTSPSSMAASHPDLCYVCDSSSDLVARTKEALGEDHPTLRAKRVSAAQRHGWDARVQNACDLLENLKGAATVRELQP